MRTSKRDWRTERRLCKLVAALSLIGVAAGNNRAASQPPPPSHNIAGVQSHFQSAIDRLAAVWHVAIVAESAPVTEKPGADLAPSHLNEVSSQAVERVAAAFDYSVSRADKVFVLAKRFTDADDLPDVTLLEAANALDASIAILGSLDRLYPANSGQFNPQATAISLCLTREQLLALSRPGVPISSLDKEQRAEALRLASWFYHSRLAPIEKQLRVASASLKAVAASDPELYMSKRSHGGAVRDEFGFDTPDGADGISEITPAPVQAKVDPGQIMTALISALPRSVNTFMEARMKALNLPASFKQQSGAVEFYRSIGFTAYSAALQKTAEIAKPMADRAKDKKVRVSELPESCRAMFATAESILDLSTVQWLSSVEVPLYVRDFEHAVLSGRYTASGDSATLTIRFLNSDSTSGAMVVSPQIVEGRVPPK